MINVLPVLALALSQASTAQELQPAGAISPVAERCGPSNNVVCVNKFVSQLFEEAGKKDI